MKNNLIILVLVTLLYVPVSAQLTPAGFQKKWQAIDSLINIKDLPKTALQQVNQLYQEAARQKNEAEVVKALVYRNSLESRVKETDINKIIATLETQVNQAFSVPQKSILQTILAATYHDYFDQNRWRLYNRSNTIPYQKQDIATWNTADFYNRISTLYKEALQPATQLQQTRLDKYEPVIIAGNTRQLRPTLFDLLAHKALDFYKSGDAFAAQLNQSSHFSDPAVFAPAGSFIQHNFSTASGTDSIAQQALRLFQSLLRFHQNDASVSALADVDIERISWVYQQSTNADKEQLYAHALKQLTTVYQGNPVTQQAWYLQAALLAENSNYDPLQTGDSSKRYNKVKAKAIIDQHLDNTGSLNEGNVNMMQLRDNITEKSLFVQTETVNSPGAPFRMYVRYQNVDTLYGRLIRFPAGADDDNYYRDDFWKKITSLSSFLRFNQVLPATHDYQTHATEIKIDALPPGKYLFIGSARPGFNSNTDQMAAQFFSVSALSYIHHGKDYFVLDRESGQPVSQVRAAISRMEWNNSSNSNKPVLIETKTTDKNGYFQLGNYDEKVRNLQIKLIGQNDTLSLSNADYIPFTNETVLKAGADEEKRMPVFSFLPTEVFTAPGKLFILKA